MIDDLAKEDQRGRQLTDLISETIGVIVESMVISSQLMV